MDAVERAWIGLGGNIGDVQAALARALRSLHADERTTVTAVSDLWRTPPWGVEDQPDFLNCCAVLRTALAPLELLDLCQRIERDGARERRQRWGPRTIDLDVIAYEGVEDADPRLTLPHPRAAERAFVTVPLAQVAPGLTLGGRPVASLSREADRSGMMRVRLPEGWWRD